MTSTIRVSLELEARERRIADAAEYLLAIDDDVFADLVERDIRGVLDADLGDVLGHPRVAIRWARALKVKRVDLSAQYALRKGREWDEWRSRANTYGLKLADRTARARHAVEFARTEARRIADERPPKPLREASRRAMDRLIQAHREEFAHLLAEERAKDETA